MDNRQFRNAMGKFATGVTVITTQVDGEPFGMTANAFMSVSLDPKLVVISVGHNAKMLQRIQQSNRFAVNILSADQQEFSALFAGQKNIDGMIEFTTLAGLPILKDTIATIACNVVNVHEAGDHTLFIGEVTDIRLDEGEPLLFFQGHYHALNQSILSKN
ncbi:flavin reductase family protein [Bacillus sp. JJ1764]|uniref:flavin reductase family protein n=1 Tax=Bacillus sp. JJ1764 TaxID=3122964 RepID=UPI002FFF827D